MDRIGYYDNMIIFYDARRGGGIYVLGGVEKTCGAEGRRRARISER